MASSALQTQGFIDPYSFNYDDALGRNYDGNYEQDSQWGTSGLFGFFRKLDGEDLDWKKQRATEAAAQEYERQSINSARAWSEYMDNTQYQRRVKDLEAAGLNPWLAVQNGISGSGSPSVDTGGSAGRQTKSDQSLTGLAQLLLAIVKILS